MKTYRALFGTAAVVAAAFALAAVAGAAQDKARDGDEKDKTKPKVGGRAYLGKVERVDADKRTLVLTTLPGREDPDAKERQPKARPLTFTVGSTATVTLDGRKAALGDLKAGHYARVHAGPSSADLGGDTSKDREKRPKGKESDVREGAVAVRIEAFTKEPTDRGEDKK